MYKKIKVGKIFRKHMKPFLEKNGFKAESMTSGSYDFYYEKNPEKKINYSISSYYNAISVYVVNGKTINYCNMFSLTDFIFGPSLFDSYINLPSHFFYDNEEEFLGILEYHAELFENWVFDWILGKNEFDHNAIIKTNSSCEEIFAKYTNFEINKLLISNNKLEDWQKIRFMPNEWKL